MRWIWSIMIAWFFLSGCEGEAALSHEPSDLSHASGMVSILVELTGVMDHPEQEPSTVLQNVRAYVSSNRQRVSDAVNTLNRAMLEMPESDRERYRMQATPSVGKALEDYAHAQIALRKRMTEAQQWELGEALMQLR